MKKMKKILSVLLASVMTLAMAAPSFAVEGGSTPITSLTPSTTNPSTPETKGTIIIDNPAIKKGTEKEELEDYTAYKIFDVTYNGDNYAYSISKDSPWFDVVITNITGGLGETEFTQNSLIEGLTFTKAVGEDVYYVAVDEKTFSAAKFAETLSNALDVMKENPPKGIVLEGSAEGVAATNLDLGYYFVTTSSSVLCNLTTTNPSVIIHDKNEAPEISKKIVEGEKRVDEASVDVGGTVTFEITGNVPDMTGYESYTYTVIDTMSPGLTFENDSEKVMIDGSVGEVTVTSAPVDVKGRDGKGTELTFNIEVYGKNYKYDAPITLTYNATVNKDAVAVDSETNTAKLEYSNDPANPEGIGKTPETPEVEVYTSKIIIDKYDGADASKETKLEKAQFVLQNGKEDGAKYYKYSETVVEGVTTAKVEWVDNEQEATTLTTDKNGEAPINGLKDGTYYLKETVAPAGFNKLETLVEIVINGEKKEITNQTTNETTKVRTLTYTASVENNAGALLPSTGGIGTTIFYAAGIILMAGAVFFVVRRKRA